MRFGPLPTGEAEGAILAHALRAGHTRLRKGMRLDAAAIAALRRAGVESVVVARLDPGDVAEDEAAARLGAVMAGQGIVAADARTGRVDLLAAWDGLFDADRAVVDRINAVDPDITLATLWPDTPVAAGQAVATIKIISYGVAAVALDAAIAAVTGPALSVRRFAPLQAELIQTALADTRPSVLDKTRAVTADRLAALGGTLVGERRVPHAPEPVADALRTRSQGIDLVLVAGIAAIADRADVIPAALTAVGGRIVRLGMPVEPGNLLLVGMLPDGVPLIGLPGCARSPALNGIDLVLRRLAAGCPPDAASVARMGVGGLIRSVR